MVNTCAISDWHRTQTLCRLTPCDSTGGSEVCEVSSSVEAWWQEAEWCGAVGGRNVVEEEEGTDEVEVEAEDRANENDAAADACACDEFEHSRSVTYSA